MEDNLLGQDLEANDGTPESPLTHMERTLCQLSLPVRKPREGTEKWARRNGNLSMELIPHYDENGKAIWPYGIIPRLFLAWLTDQVVKGTDAVDVEDERKIWLSDSLRGFLKDLGIIYTGKEAVRIKEQIYALSRVVLNVEQAGVSDAGKGYRRGVNMPFIAKYSLLYSDKETDDQPGLDLDRSFVTLSQEFLGLIKKNAVPLELEVLQTIRTSGGGALAFDQYAWIQYRLNRAKARHESYPIRSKWSELVDQFGSQYKLLRQFKAEFLKQLARTQDAWGGFTYQVWESHLAIWPGRLEVIEP